MKNNLLFLLAALVCLLSSCEKFKRQGDGSGDFHTSFTVSSVAPIEGEPGSIITIRGIGFSKDSLKNTVQINTSVAKIIKSSDTSLQAIVPETNSITGTISVSVNNIKSTNSFYFHYCDVYVTGFVYNASRSFARLWKNGIVQSYPDSSFNTATRLSHDGTDIYFGTNRGYFKNNLYVKLNNKSSYTGNVNSVAINKGDVYAGNAGGYYKNGVFKKLSFEIEYPVVNDIVFDKDSSFMAAYDPKNGRGILYKNDKRIPLLRGDRHAEATVVVINGNDVHVGGDNDELSPNAVEWINGTNKAIFGFGEVYDIAFAGNDEYVAGSGYNNLLYIKNGVSVLLSDKSVYFSGASLFTLNNSIYVAGSFSNSSSFSQSYYNPTHVDLPTSTVEAVYFRNGIKTVLPRSSYLGAEANSILVLMR